MTLGIPEIESLKQRQKATWMAGDFGEIAKYGEAGAAEFIARLGLQPGYRVLDVGCGSGNQSLPAARIGADVTGVDIATNLLEQARSRAAAEGLPATFQEGDAEQLPFGDNAFDVVVSMFGAMFAPRPELVSLELTRVCIPGGRIAMGNWTPEGFAGQLFKVTAKHAPPPPHDPPPTLWGKEEVVKERLGNGTRNLQFTRRMYTMKFPFPPSEVVEFFRTYFGPTQRAFDSLDADGQGALREDQEALWAEHNRAQDGTTEVMSEYLEVIATK
jgi:SAM-dependent methyltransferase